MTRDAAHIGRRAVGPGQPCYVIAEVGSNHNGSLAVAENLIRQCAAAGADAVKFQAFRRETLFVPDLPDDGSDITRRNRALLHKRWQVLPGQTADPGWWPHLKQVCDDAGVDFLCTPFSIEVLDELLAVGMPAVKIASGDITWLELIAAAARTGRPLILSTGASDLAEVDAAVAAARNAGAKALAILHCVSSYPTDWAEANLRAIEALRTRFGPVVGLSDHSLGSTLPIAAVALGACVIEKHVTDDRSQAGLDHHFALEVGEFRQMVTEIRDTEAALGTGTKTFTPSEQVERFWVRRGLWLAKPVSAGTALQRHHLAVLRPASGLGAEALDTVLGRTAARDLAPGAPLHAGDLCPPDRLDGDPNQAPATGTSEIRRVTNPADGGACAAFVSARNRDTFNLSFPQAALTAFETRFDAGQLRELIASTTGIVATAGAPPEVTGLIIGRVSGHGIATLEWLAVLPGSRNQGIGRHLVEIFVSSAATYGAHKVIVYTETEAGRRFYQRAGFVEEANHPCHWWRVRHVGLARPIPPHADRNHA